MPDGHVVNPGSLSDTEISRRYYSELFGNAASIMAGASQQSRGEQRPRSVEEKVREWQAAQKRAKPASPAGLQVHEYAVPVPHASAQSRNKGVKGIDFLYETAIPMSEAARKPSRIAVARAGKSRNDSEPGLLGPAARWLGKNWGKTFAVGAAGLAALVAVSSTSVTTPAGHQAHHASGTDLKKTTMVAPKPVVAVLQQAQNAPVFDVNLGRVSTNMPRAVNLAEGSGVFVNMGMRPIPLQAVSTTAPAKVSMAFGGHRHEHHQIYASNARPAGHVSGPAHVSAQPVQTAEQILRPLEERVHALVRMAQRESATHNTSLKANGFDRLSMSAPAQRPGERLKSLAKRTMTMLASLGNGSDMPVVQDAPAGKSLGDMLPRYRETKGPTMLDMLPAQRRHEIVKSYA